jgi:prepilin-type N-terminal cleavage/methylation domain-containing protein
MTAFAPTPPATALGPTQPKDQGMTLIEVLVGMALFSVLGVLLLGLALSTSRVTQATRDRAGVNDETRAAMERMTRELRQATSVDSVQLPAGGVPGPTSLTFWTDFDGDGARSATAVDPEVLTYAWTPATGRLTLTAQSIGPTTTAPLLAAEVASFVVELRSSRWEYDADGNGTTTWQELDAAGPPVGNGDGTADQPELTYVDSIGILMTVQDGGGTQTHRTTIDLRNRN